MGHIVTYGAGSCTFVGVPTSEGGKPFPECDQWNARVMDELRALRPDVVVTSANPSLHLEGETTPDEHESAVVPALSEQWRIVQRIAPLVVIGNSPDSERPRRLCRTQPRRPLGP